MADIELVVKLDEGYIKQIDKIRFLIGGIEDRSLQINVINAIKNGKTLPKGHGRLIDIDLLRDQVSHDEREAFSKHQVWLLLSVHNKKIPTIIEADKEQKDE